MILLIFCVIGLQVYTIFFLRVPKVPSKDSKSSATQVHKRSPIKEFEVINRKQWELEQKAGDLPKSKADEF